MNKLYERLQEIKKRPELYLGEKSLNRLDAYILGYLQCMKDNNGEENKLFDGFGEYIQNKYNVKTHNATQIISFYSMTKERAFYKFYDLLDTYLQLHPENLG